MDPGLKGLLKNINPQPFRIHCLSNQNKLYPSEKEACTKHTDRKVSWPLRTKAYWAAQLSRGSSKGMCSRGARLGLDACQWMGSPIQSSISLGCDLATKSQGKLGDQAAYILLCYYPKSHRTSQREKGKGSFLPERHSPKGKVLGSHLQNCVLEKVLQNKRHQNLTGLTLNNFSVTWIFWEQFQLNWSGHIRAAVKPKYISRK